MLTFNPGGDEKHVLIDCGTLGSKYTDVKLPHVIDDIDKTTNGRLHLVVVTHQHQDHLSGFSKVSGQFRDAKGRRLTMSGWPGPRIGKIRWHGRGMVSVDQGATGSKPGADSAHVY